MAHCIKKCMLKHVISSEHSTYAGSDKPIRKHYVNCIAHIQGDPLKSSPISR